MTTFKEGDIVSVRGKVVSEFEEITGETFVTVDFGNRLGGSVKPDQVTLVDRPIKVGGKVFYKERTFEVIGMDGEMLWLFKQTSGAPLYYTVHKNEVRNAE